MPLRTRLILVALSSILLVAGLLTGAGWMARYAAEERLQHTATSYNATLWQQVISSRLDRMQAAMFGLTRNRTAIRALEQHNRKTLAQSVRPTYNRLSTSRIITQLVVVDTDGAMMFSAPKHDFGSTLSPIILETAGTGKIKRGLLKNRENQLIAFLAFPLYARHVLVGIGMFVHDLQTPLEVFSHYDSTEAFILYADGTPAYATDPEMLSRLTLALPQLGQSTLAHTKLGANVYAVTISPLTDIIGAPQAHLVSIKDHTTAHAQQQLITRLTYTIIIVVLVLSLIGLWWYVHRAFSPLRATIAAMHTLTENEGSMAQLMAETNLAAMLTPPAKASAANEITALTTAFRHMIEKRQQVEEENAHLLTQTEAAHRAKCEFLDNISHEIRTPLNGIMGMTGLLLGTALSPEQREYADTVRHSSEILLNLINDILDFSKIETGKLVLERVEFDLRTTLEDVLELLAEQASAKHLDLVGKLHPNVPCQVEGDPARLHQLLTHLVGNAVKFTETGKVSVQVTLLEESDAEAVIRFDITDTGIGIPVELQSQLFQLFSQADGSTSRKYGGTGLGLAISQQLVTLMRGTIGVDSIPGSGSTFWFTIPLAKPSPFQSTAPQDTAALDAQTIDALKTLCPDGSTAFLQELITPFLQETSSQLADLNTAVDAADTYALEYTAHALKGSCTYMGAQNMAMLCQNVQILSQQPVTPMADIIAAIEQLTAEFDRVRHALEAETKQLKNEA